MEKLSTSMQSPSTWDSAANMVIFDQPDDDLYVLFAEQEMLICSQSLTGR